MRVQRVESDQTKKHIKYWSTQIVNKLSLKIKNEEKVIKKNYIIQYIIRKAWLQYQWISGRLSHYIWRLWHMTLRTNFESSG